MTSAIMLAMDESTKWMLAPLVLPIFLWAMWHKVQRLRRQENPTGSYKNLTERISVSLWAIARLWYTLFGLILLAMLVNAWQYGFDELRDIIFGLRPVGWLVIAAMFAPGPLAHWLAKRLKR